MKFSVWTPIRCLIASKHVFIGGKFAVYTFIGPCLNIILFFSIEDFNPYTSLVKQAVLKRSNGLLDQLLIYILFCIFLSIRLYLILLLIKPSVATTLLRTSWPECFVVFPELSSASTFPTIQALQIYIIAVMFLDRLHYLLVMQHMRVRYLLLVIGDDRFLAKYSIRCFGVQESILDTCEEIRLVLLCFCKPRDVCHSKWYFSIAESWHTHKYHFS